MRGSLTSFTRRRGVAAPGTGPLAGVALAHPVPAGFDAVAEALAAGDSPVPACTVAGRALAQDGASLGEVLSGLRSTYAALGGAAPDFDAAEALSVAWSESTLEFLHDLSCEDPLTGLATLAHLRTRLAEVYREAERSGEVVRATHALVVIEVLDHPPRLVAVDSPGPSETSASAALPGVDAAFSRALRLASVADAARTVFAGEETIARVGGDRVAVLVRRSRELGETVGLVREMLVDLQVAEDPRLWIEGLPAHAETAVRLLSELARSS